MAAFINDVDNGNNFDIDAFVERDRKRLQEGLKEASTLAADGIGFAWSTGTVGKGGAGAASHLIDAVREGGADAVLVAGILHDRLTTVALLKRHMHAAGLPMRPVFEVAT